MGMVKLNVEEARWRHWMRTLDGEMSEGDTAWGGDGGRCWMGRHLLSYHLSQSIYFTFLAENNPGNLPSLPL